MTDVLFTPAKLGSIEIGNRIVMAPMTRSRATVDGVPTQLMVDYYRQRASAGLIISEGTQPSASGQGYCRTPGIYTDQQIEAWQRVTQAVKHEGGNMVMQIMHCGRIASYLNKSDGAETVAPSPIQANGKMYTDQQGMVNFDVPQELSIEQIKHVIADYAQAATNAITAGFAGVEIHVTSGYLPAQFLSTGTNQRDDEYGGSVTNRCRFVNEVLSELYVAIGADRVGMRICPGNPFNDLSDDNPRETFTELLSGSVCQQLAYLHVIRMDDSITGVDNLSLATKLYGGALIFNDSYSASEAAVAISDQRASAVSFGRDFIANPDLVARFQQQRELAKFDPKTLYTLGAEGYSTYAPLTD